MDGGPGQLIASAPPAGPRGAGSGRPRRGHVGARADGHAQVGRGQRGGVVHPVAHHRHPVPAPCRSRMPRPAGRRIPAITSSMPTAAATARRRLVVAGEQDRPQPRRSSPATAAAADGLTVLPTASAPRSRPSQPTRTAVWPVRSHCAHWLASPAGSRPRGRAAAARGRRRPGGPPPRRVPPGPAAPGSLRQSGRPSGALSGAALAAAALLRSGADRGGDRVLRSALDRSRRSGAPPRVRCPARRPARSRPSGRWSRCPSYRTPPCRSARTTRVPDVP